MTRERAHTARRNRGGSKKLEEPVFTGVNWKQGCVELLDANDNVRVEVIQADSFIVTLFDPTGNRRIMVIADDKMGPIQVHPFDNARLTLLPTIRHT